MSSTPAMPSAGTRIPRVSSSPTSTSTIPAIACCWRNCSATSTTRRKRRLGPSRTRGCHDFYGTALLDADRRRLLSLAGGAPPLPGDRRRAAGGQRRLLRLSLLAPSFPDPGLLRGRLVVWRV